MTYPFLEPLGLDWRDTLDGIAKERRFPTSGEVSKLAPLVARLSALYNDRSARAPGADDAGALAARLLFSFPRDVNKGAGAVRELVAAGLLPQEGPIRVLDIGAGLGAMTWGIARAVGAERAGAIEADLSDHHAGALALADRIGKARSEGLRIRTHQLSAEHGMPYGTGTYDIVVAGQVLSELDRDASDDERVHRHETLLRRWLERLHPKGSLVVVEPALRDRTRHLQRVRDALAANSASIAGAGTRANIFAPCLHSAACPMLVRETDWCHEDLAVDLPDWLTPVARAAGLRWQGLTFSYLVLRRDGITLHDATRVDGASKNSLFREVSGLLRTKGKTERFLCGKSGEFSGGLRAMRLDRAASDNNQAWDDAERGDVLAFDPGLDVAKPRIEASMRVTSSNLSNHLELPRVDATRRPR